MSSQNRVATGFFMAWFAFVGILAITLGAGSIYVIWHFLEKVW